LLLTPGVEGDKSVLGVVGTVVFLFFAYLLALVLLELLIRGKGDLTPISAALMELNLFRVCIFTLAFLVLIAFLITLNGYQA